MDVTEHCVGGLLPHYLSCLLLKGTEGLTLCIPKSLIVQGGAAFIIFICIVLWWPQRGDETKCAIALS
jgi:hypothetical protein